MHRSCFRLAFQHTRLYSTETKSALKQTVFHDFHIEQGAKMVEFAGYSMPLQYASQSVMTSHKHVRHSCGIFDVSHMMQIHIHGAHRSSFMNSLIVADVDALPPGKGSLSVYTNDQGGIKDDLIVTNAAGDNLLYVVSNAGCADKILPYLQMKSEEYKRKGYEVDLKVLDNALLAVQGPEAHTVIQRGLPFPLQELGFMESRMTDVFGMGPCRVTRCGYTGEDGVEVSIPRELALEILKRLLENSSTALIGLAARDLLRLEAGLCLYGNDIDETTTPVEASLTWTIAKSRLNDNRNTFPGWNIVVGQMKKTLPVVRKRIGLISETGLVPRHGTKILCPETEKENGVITSGAYSPMLSKNIAMAYVPLSHSKSGQPLLLSVRNKLQKAVVNKMPFVKTSYYQKS
jgi:aminomethyltransferase